MIALRVFFPSAGIIDWFAIALCALAFVAMLRYKIDIVPVVLASGLFGLLFRLVIAR
jgi:chromate transporter